MPISALPTRFMTVREPPFADVLDSARLAALDEYAILDTDAEKGFDDVVLLAQNICDVPIALVSFVAADRVWCKARIGFPDCETDLNSSVCAHVLTEQDLLVIPDLAQDPRTQTSPLVSGGPRIRFYAGAPLRTPDGMVLGSLCVIDVEPRPRGLSANQAESLRALAGQVMAQLELRRALADHRRLLIEQDEVIRTQAAVSFARGELAVMLNALVTGAMEVMPHAEGAVVVTREGEELVYRATKGVLAPHAGLRVPLRSTLAGACLLSGEPILVPDVQKDARVKRDLAASLDSRSCVLMPVRRAGEAVGVLKLQSSQPGAFTLRDLKLAQVLAGTMSAGLAEVAEAIARRDAEAHLRRAQEAGGVGVFTVGGDGILYPTPEYCRLYGLPPRESYPSTAFEALVLPEDAHLVSTAASRRSGQAPCDVEYRIRRPDTGEVRWIARKGEFEYDEAGRPVRFNAVARDITERKLAEDRQRLLTGELQHRVKNTLALVQAIASQTFRNATDLDTARETFAARLISLGRAHEILTGSSWTEAPVADVVEGALAVHRDAAGTRIRAGGPNVLLAAGPALSLTLALHELATNAAKYGALSNESGVVDLRWHVVHDGEPPRFCLTWSEHGGPQILSPPARRGFGSRLIERSFAAEAGGEVRMTYAPSGFVCHLEAPLAFMQGCREEAA
jgi:PAS domain S-box-containing protein